MTIRSKRLEGIEYVPELEEICRATLRLSTKNITDQSILSNDEVSSSAMGKALALIPSTEAKEIIENILNWEEAKKKHLGFPISAVKALISLIKKSSESEDSKNKLSNDLEKTLAKTTSLRFTRQLSTAIAGVDEQREKYLKRIEMLRLKAEEAKYSKLTKNIDKRKKEDAGTRTMTYAASIGLNMIIAPLSFGALCYFFSRSLFGWIDGYDPDVDEVSYDIDIRRVIFGVMAGVVMMFIEMILFVIRSHEMDEHLRKKEKKKNLNPFGYDKNRRNNERTFTGGVYS